VERATISQLKDRLSAYLRKVRSGETILVVDRDEPIARIERIAPGATADARSARLEAAGLVRRGSRPLDVAALRRPAPTPRASVVGALLEERRDGR
jgi:antitoxin (DNA-binding transcriptional repressor) of toxin-antitoxin stability system